MQSTKAAVLPMAITLVVVPALRSKSILAQGADFLTYENNDFGFGIQYPSDWKKEEESTSKSSNVNIVVSFVKKNGSQINSEEDLYIRTEEFLGKIITLEEFAQLQKAYTYGLLVVSSLTKLKRLLQINLRGRLNIPSRALAKLLDKA